MTVETASQLLGDQGDVAINIFDMMESLSTALDLINPDLDTHHRKVCYIAVCLAEELMLGDDDFNDIFAAAILHDIGGVAMSNLSNLKEFENKSLHLHAELGHILLCKFPTFARFAPLVRFHHVLWEQGAGMTFNGIEVPYYSHLLHLADRISVLLDSSKPIFSQIDFIRNRINDSNDEWFVPDFVDTFLNLSRKEVFWLDLASSSIDKVLRRKSRFQKVTLNLDDLMSLSKFYALIIDSRSRFTATHSSGVAASAEALARLVGMTPITCKKIKIAGYLHDIGKLAVPSAVLEKNGELDLEEWRIVRTHTYYTRKILEVVNGLEEITTWASDHHEHLNGDGYPLHIGADQMPLGSRVLAVADVFTAISENRPYRKGMSKQEVHGVLTEMVDSGKLDRRVTTALLDNYDTVFAIRESAQQAESHGLAEFWELARSGGV